jgi:type I restriction enzyme M protein
MDSSEFKEYIFGILFLNRMSDQFEADRTSLKSEYEKKGMKPDLIEKQLANPKVGLRTMDDNTLVDFIQHFNEIPLSNEDFEFPDLMGATYEMIELKKWYYHKLKQTKTGLMQDLLTGKVQMKVDEEDGSA